MFLLSLWLPTIGDKEEDVLVHAPLRKQRAAAAATHWAASLQGKKVLGGGGEFPFTLFFLFIIDGLIAILIKIGLPHLRRNFCVYNNSNT
jgi:hypothetical protein